MPRRSAKQLSPLEYFWTAAVKYGWQRSCAGGFPGCYGWHDGLFGRSRLFVHNDISVLATAADPVVISEFHVPHSADLLHQLNCALYALPCGRAVKQVLARIGPATQVPATSRVACVKQLVNRVATDVETEVPDCDLRFRDRFAKESVVLRSFRDDLATAVVQLRQGVLGTFALPGGKSSTFEERVLLALQTVGVV